MGIARRGCVLITSGCPSGPSCTPHSGRVGSLQHLVGRGGRESMKPSILPPLMSRTDAGCVCGPPSWLSELVTYGGRQTPPWNLSGDAHRERAVGVRRDAVGAGVRAEVLIEAPVLLDDEDQVVELLDAARAPTGSLDPGTRGGVAVPDVHAATTTAVAMASRSRRRSRMAAESIGARSEQRERLRLFPRPRIQDQRRLRLLREVERVPQVAGERLADRGSASGRPSVAGSSRCAAQEPVLDQLQIGVERQLPCGRSSPRLAYGLITRPGTRRP